MKERWQELYEMGKRAFNEKNYEEARTIFEKVIRAKDDCADVYNMLGVIYFIDNRYDDAIRAFRRALDINPFYIEASLNLSIVYNETGEFDKAQQAYAAAKASSGRSTRTYLDPYVKGRLANKHAEIGDIYRELGLYYDAAREYNMALALRADLVDVKMRLGMVYRNMGDYKKSIAELREAKELNPKFLPARIQLGLTYYAMGDKDRAREEWSEVLKYNPNDRLVRMYLKLVGIKG